jgi:pyrroloquinoline quinone (PQQ) biosynthesis protein C
MGFNGEAFVQDLREELQASGRTLDKAVWVEKVVQGDATKEDLVGWARQHYWGVTYHTRRFLSEWVTRIPYEMTQSHLYWLFHFTRSLGAPDEVITDATPNVDAVANESFLANLAHQRPWHEMMFGGILGIENQIPEAYTRVVDGFQRNYAEILQPDDYAFHTIHIVVDEDHGGHVGEFAEQYLDTEAKRRSARAAYLAGAELTRRCWDAFDGASW